MTEPGMKELARIGLVCEGDASRSETAFSGTAKQIFECLAKRGHHVVPVNASLTGIRRAAVAAASVSPDRARWRSKFRYGGFGARNRTAAASASLGRCKVDVILQVGATHDPPGSGTVPYAIYADWNMALTAAEAASGGGKSRGLSTEEIKKIDSEHGRRYERAAAIFTISGRLRSSFIELYGIPQDRVHTAYAGPNFDIALIDASLRQPKKSVVPTVLFIAKEFHRKGGATVASAFAKVKETLPEARLVFVGLEKLPEELRSIDNVDHLGLLDKANPDQIQYLLAAYRDADVLVLPSRQDPFPTVIREAMFFGLPCVASNIWAMPEMIEDGKTGFLVPFDDAEALRSRLLLLLRDRGLRIMMGRAARARAEEMFSWSAVGKVLSEVLGRCRADEPTFPPP
jgi:glycosyltransferase involved in cell wall biosynthesis